MFWNHCDTFYSGMGAFTQCNPAYTYAFGTWGWGHRYWRSWGWR